MSTSVISAKILTVGSHLHGTSQSGPMIRGELFELRATGSTGTLLCGLWPAGVGIACCEPDGSTAIPYTSPLDDEIELLLEGHFQVVDEGTRGDT